MKGKAILLIAILLSPSNLALAGNGKSCLTVVNVAPSDTLKIRQRPSASSRIVAELVQQNHGVIGLVGPCQPNYVSAAKRWCPINYYSADAGVLHGWVKARFVKASYCPD